VKINICLILHKIKVMKKLLSLLVVIASSGALFAQTFDYYFIGDTSDVSPQTTFGVCMMGGATEDDNGSAWFLNRANGGNIVVIRASGSDGYNEYFYSDLGVNVQSVETIVFKNASAAEDPFVLSRLERAEAIWIAGGDQYVYEQYWKNSSVMTILNDHVNQKNAPIGGTSAGMAILGEHYFNAEVSSVTSTQALANPYAAGVTLATDFLAIPFLENTITDTHYDNPDRRGRHSVFIARIMEMIGGRAFGIAAEEYVAICVDENGLATIFGEYPDYDDKAYFIQSNCRNEQPEVMESNTPITWITDDEDALVVYEVEARNDGSSTFDLMTWGSGQNGLWKYWTINQGMIAVNNGAAPDCLLGAGEIKKEIVKLFPNPTSDKLNILSDNPIEHIFIFSANGQQVYTSNGNETIDVSGFDNGIYFARIHNNSGVFYSKFVVNQ
jgi:cyanophycinase-like exopeptidase